MRLFLALQLFVFSAAVASAESEERTYFRFTNKGGGVELKATITPAEAKRGYSIVTLGGHVIKKVAPALTDEQYAMRSQEIQLAEQKRLLEESKRDYDEALLLRYSTVDDLLAEKKRKLSEFDIRISILKSNLAGLKEKLDTQQSRAAKIERKGRDVPNYLSKNIAELEAEMREAEANINSRQQEKQHVDNKYTADATRLDGLIGRFNR